MVRGGPVGARPAAPPDAAGGDAALVELELVQDLVAEWARHPDGPLDRRRPAEPQVAGAVDRIAVVLRQHVTEEVGEHALHDAAAVEPHAGRAPHDPDGAIDLDRRPAPLRAWTGGMARRGERKRLLQWDRRGLVAAVARRLQLADEGRIHEPAGARGGG